MLILYRCLLYLYPAAYRHEYAEEMTFVFCQAQKAVRSEGLAARASFCAREIAGLLFGALREHFRSIADSYDCIPFTRFDMHPEFRFPRSTLFLMLVILAGVVLAIQKAKSIQLKYGAGANLMSVWPVLPWSLAFMLVLVCATVAIIWAILFALRRTGMHRIAKVQTWPEHR
jgi:hypothetical protein